MIKYADAEKIRMMCIEDSDYCFTDIEEYFEDIEDSLEKNETIEQVLRRLPSYIYGTDKVIPRIDANFIVDTLSKNCALREDYDDILKIKELQRMLDVWCNEVADMYLTDYEYKIDISDEVEEYLKDRKGR